MAPFSRTPDCHQRTITDTQSGLSVSSSSQTEICTYPKTCPAFSLVTPISASASPIAPSRELDRALAPANHPGSSHLCVCWFNPLLARSPALRGQPLGDVRVLTALLTFKCPSTTCVLNNDLIQCLPENTICQNASLPCNLQ